MKSEPVLHNNQYHIIWSHRASVTEVPLYMESVNWRIPTVTAWISNSPQMLFLLILYMKVEQYHSKKTLSPKDENLWNSHCCLRGHGPENFIFLIFLKKIQ